jgi:hypothetical protein
MTLKEFYDYIINHGGRAEDKLLFVDNQSCGTNYEIICDDEAIYVKFAGKFE